MSEWERWNCCQFFRVDSLVVRGTQAWVDIGISKAEGSLEEPRDIYRAGTLLLFVGLCPTEWNHSEYWQWTGLMSLLVPKGGQCGEYGFFVYSILPGILRLVSFFYSFHYIRIFILLRYNVDQTFDSLSKQLCCTICSQSKNRSSWSRCPQCASFLETNAPHSRLAYCATVMPE